jgi:DinB superfamily
MVMPHALQIAALRSALADVRRAVTGVPPAALNAPLDDGWSMLDVIGHLAAVDAMMFERYQLMVNEVEPAVVGRIPDSAYKGVAITLDAALAQWAAQREALCAWLDGLPPGAFNRRARHNERGSITLRSEVQIVIAHDTEHLNQLIALRQHWADGKHP